MQARFGLTHESSYYIAGTIVFAAAIEYHLERYIWRINNIDPKGQRPKTDGKPVSDWIRTLSAYAATLPEADGRMMLETWCKAAFKFRHDIAHGVPVNVKGAVAFNRNPRWQGELRSREHTDFWADEPVLKLLLDSIAVLVRMISELQNGHISSAFMPTISVFIAVCAPRKVDLRFQTGLPADQQGSRATGLHFCLSWLALAQLGVKVHPGILQNSKFFRDEN